MGVDLEHQIIEQKMTMYDYTKGRAHEKSFHSLVLTIIRTVDLEVVYTSASELSDVHC